MVLEAHRAPDPPSAVGDPEDPERHGEREGSDGLGEALPQYLREIGRVPLLTAADEVRLAQAFEEGQAALASLRSGNEAVSPEERARLEALIATGERARAQLAEANLRLVVSIARRYANRGVALVDLVQEGNLGLLRAVEKFDWRRGFKFSTYATWWIRQSVTRAVADDGRTIRIPVHLYDLVHRIARARAQLHQELAREPTTDEVAQLMGLPAERVREMAQVTPPPISLDGFVGEAQDTRLSDLLPDRGGPDMDDMAGHRLLRDDLHATLSTLTPRERAVIERRFGLIDDHESTLTEIGREIGLTRERIRQIESTAMDKLRHPSRARSLRRHVL